MPEGSHLSFRYRKEWLPLALQTKFAHGDISNTKALICYLEWPNSPGPCTAVPCRYATILNSQCYKTWYTLTMRLEEIPAFRDIEKLNREIQGMTTEFPEKTKDKVIGKYCHLIKNELTNVAQGKDIEDWENVVTALSKYPAFADQKYFYHVEGVKEIRKNSTYLDQKNGGYLLSDSSDYQLDIVHFHPNDQHFKSDKPEDESYLLAEVNDDSLQFTTNNELLIDSPYDKKVIRLRTNKVIQKRHAIVSLCQVVRDSSSPKDKKGTVLCELQIDTKINIVRAWLAIVILGVILACEGIIVASKNIPGTYGSTVTIIAILVAAFFTSIAAYFGLRKAVA